MEKIKRFINETIETMQSEKGKDLLIVVIVILVGLGSFELGRLSKTNTSSGIKIEYPNNQDFKQIGNQTASTILSKNSSLGTNTKTSQTTSNSTGKNFFASSRGSKYYSIGCSAGKSLKLENRIYFATKEEAERAGYELSSSCK